MEKLKNLLEFLRLKIEKNDKQFIILILLSIFFSAIVGEFLALFVFLLFGSAAILLIDKFKEDEEDKE